MKKAVWIILILCAVVFALEDDYLPGVVLIWLDSSLETVVDFCNDGYFITGVPEVDSLNRIVGVTDGRRIVPYDKMGSRYKRKNHYIRNAYKFTLEDRSADIPAICNEYRQLPGVLHCDPDHLIPHLRITPNDPRFRSQWHLDKIQAPEAWVFTTGDSSITVSAFESIDWKHPDIGPVLWQNLGEDANGNGYVVERYFDEELGEYSYRFDPGDVNGIDLDSNGYIDDFIGWDFIEDLCDFELIHPDEDCGPQDNDPMDDIGHIGHGTHVSGTMTIATDNFEGVAGVAWRPKIACLRTDYTYRTPYGWHGAHVTSATIAAFAYANMMGIDVYCLSYGGYSYNGMVAAVLRHAWDSCGVVIVAAAGNENTEELSYPASYERVMGVAASNRTDYRAEFSNYGRRIQISAPGVDIWSAMPRHDLVAGRRSYPYEAVDGTSMAAPIVAGAAALLKSQYPDSSNLFVYLRLQDYSDPMPDPMFEARQLGAGRLNIFRSLYQPVFPLFSVDSIAIYPDPSDEDGRITMGEVGYAVISYTSDTEWQASGPLTLSISADTEGFDFIVNNISLPAIEPGESVNNFEIPLEFSPNSSFGSGRTVTFTIKVECETGYLRRDTISMMIGYPEVLLYDRDGGALAETFIMSDLDRGGIPYEHWDADLHGTIDTDFLINNFRTVIYINGANDETPITEEDVTAFSAFLDAGGGRNFYLSGQYTADSPLITEFLEEYFRTEHVLDVVESRFWGMNVVGISGDPITEGLLLNVVLGSDCMGPQHSPGQCRALPGATIALIYRDHPSFACATRYETDEYKVFFSEFSVSGIQGTNPGGNTRYQFLYDLFRWFGYEFQGIEEAPAIPQEIAMTRAFPNPFNSSVTIEFDAVSMAHVEIKIHSIDGRMVETVHSGFLSPGSHSFNWQPKASVESGLYIYTVESDSFRAKNRLLYIK